MSNDELKTQFDLCKVWQDAEQWDALAGMYAVRGLVDNAAYCLWQSMACSPQPSPDGRWSVGVAMETAVMG